MSDMAEKLRLARVAPADWRNPTPAARYHLVVIGAGTAGLVTASAAAGLGARVALIERHQMGGDCLNVGCVPSKGLIAGGRAWHALRAAGEFGRTAEGGTHDAARVFARMREIRAEIAAVDSAERYAGLGVDVFFGAARFSGRDTIAVGDATLRFRRAVIATGARATLPPIPGLADVGARTNETIFDLPTAPARLLVLGAGPIGCELAQAFARLGSEVTLVTDTPGVLPRDLPEAAALVQASLAADGIRLVARAHVERAEREGHARRLVVTVDGRRETLEADELLVAAGRTPNVEGLDLAAAGVTLAGRGIATDDFLRTANPRIYAAGDVLDGPQFTHAADFMARAVVRNALFFGRARRSALVMPWVTYTDPEVAHVGMTHADAAAAGSAVDMLHLPMDDVDRARLDGETAGFLRLYLKAGTDRILGGTLVARHAGEMIGALALAVTHRVGLAKFATTIHPYPTQAEIFRKAGDLYNRRRLTPTVQGLFRRWFALFR